MNGKSGGGDKHELPSGFLSQSAGSHFTQVSPSRGDHQIIYSFPSKQLLDTEVWTQSQLQFCTGRAEIQHHSLQQASLPKQQVQQTSMVVVCFFSFLHWVKTQGDETFY